MTIGIGSIVILRSESVLPEGERTYMTVEKKQDDRIMVVWMDADHHFRRECFSSLCVIEIVPVSVENVGVIH